MLHGYVQEVVYTCPIRPGYVSSEYPNFYYFCEYWIRGLIRIGLVDTAQPCKTNLFPLPLTP
jgi:hypothetical protein